MGIGAQRLEVVVHGQLDVGGAGKGVADAFLERLDAPALPQERVAAARAEIGNAQVGQLLQPLDLFPHLGLGAGIEHIEREGAVMLHRGAAAQLVDDGERRDFPHRGFEPQAGKFEHELAVALFQAIFGQAEIFEPLEEGRLEDLLAAIKAVAGQPDHFLLGEAQRAGMVELGAQFVDVDLVGQLAPIWCG